MTSFETWLFAAIGGVLPAMLWLIFWIREDAKHPEPKVRIATTFLGGMIAVILVLPIENYSYHFVAANSSDMFLLWALFEEFLKLAACYVTALRLKDTDEPIDPVIYMLTTALGFAAMENTLFLLNPLGQGQIVQSIITGNLRFMGASLLHVVASGAIGVFMAFSFYGSRIWRIISAALGLITATALHAFFNLFIINEANDAAFKTFGFVWLGIIVLMLLFEKIKTIYPRYKHA